MMMMMMMNVMLLALGLLPQVEGQGDAQSMLMGEWFKYNLCVDFPTMDEDKNIVVEMFTNDPDNGL